MELKGKGIAVEYLSPTQTLEIRQKVTDLSFRYTEQSRVKLKFDHYEVEFDHGVRYSCF